MDLNLLVNAVFALVGGPLENITILFCSFFGIFSLSSSLAVFSKLMGNPALIISRIFQSDCGGESLSATQLPQGRGILTKSNTLGPPLKGRGNDRGHRAWMYKIMGR